MLRVQLLMAVTAGLLALASASCVLTSDDGDDTADPDDGDDDATDDGDDDDTASGSDDEDGTSAADDSGGSSTQDGDGGSEGTADGDSGSDEGPLECIDPSDWCESDDECCGFEDGLAVCVIDDDGQVCAATCFTDDDCEFGCCLDYEGDVGGCAPPEFCDR